MRFVLLLVAAVVAVVAGVAALQYSSKNMPNTPVAAGGEPRAASSSNVNTVDIFVAKEPISMGAVLEESMIDRQPWPEHLVLEGFVVANKDATLVGKVARAPFAAREPLMASKLANPNDPSFLAAVLPEGKRAVTLATDAISGVAGYIFPGDHVDIILTHNIPQDLKKSRKKTNTTSDKPELTEILATNIRVLAVNVRPTNKDSQTNAVPTNVTVEVSDVLAEKIRLAEKNGSLSLALRSLKDKDKTDMARVIPVQQLTRVRTIFNEASTDGVRIIRGAGQRSDGEETMSGGGASTTSRIPPSVEGE